MAFDMQKNFMFIAFEKYLNEIDEANILEVSQTICDSFMISNTSVILYYPGQVHPPHYQYYSQWPFWATGVDLETDK